MKKQAQTNNQIVGNVGLFFVCYQLSLLGWNVMPTARNAKGIDILIYSQDAERKTSLFKSRPYLLMSGFQFGWAPTSIAIR